MSDVKEKQTAPKDRAASRSDRLTDARGSDRKGIEPGRAIKPKAPAHVVLNLAAGFENPWADKPRQEIDMIEAGLWHPAIDSWEAAVGKPLPEVTGGLPNFLGFIRQQKKHSIVRLNFFSHGSRKSIALSGKIDAVSGEPSWYYEIDPNLLEAAPSFSDQGKTVNFGLGSVARALADRFAENASIVIYACNGAIDREVLQAVANTFAVRTGGFAEPLYMRNEFDTTGKRPNIKRGYMGIGSTEKHARDVQKGYKHLEPYIVWYPPKDDLHVRNPDAPGTTP
jgi:hypothetical protein